MGLAHSPRIVTNGLVLCLDAGNTKSYPGSGTAWTELTKRGSSGTLTNGPTFSSTNKGSIVFDGTNDYVNIPGMSTSFGGSGATMLVWLKRNGTQGDWTGVFWSRVGALYHGIGFYSNTGQLQYAWNGNKGPTTTSPNFIPPDNTWVMAVVRIVGTFYGELTLFTPTNKFTHGNGAYQGNGTDLTANLSDLKLGAEGLIGGRFFKGNIGVAMLYNRVISDAEMQQNFNALRGRFGI